MSIDDAMKTLRKEDKNDDVEESLQNIEDDDEFEAFIRNTRAKRAKLKDQKKATIVSIYLSVEAYKDAQWSCI